MRVISRSISILALALSAWLVSGSASAQPHDRATVVRGLRAALRPSDRSAALAQGSSLAVRPTSLLGVPIDPAVVERLLRSRLAEVQSQVLRDVLTGDLAALRDCAPCMDLVTTIGALSAQVMEGDARSAAITSAATRVGLSFAIAALPSNLAFPGPCGDRTDDPTARVVQRANAVYAALKRSTLLGGLGFPNVVETAMPDERCHAMSERVEHAIDTIGRVGTDLQGLRRLSEDAQKAQTTCGEVTELGPEFQSALRAVPSEAELVTLRRLRELRNAFSRARGDLPRPAAGETLQRCLTALQSLQSRFDDTMGRVAGDLDQDASLRDLMRQVIAIVDPASRDVVVGSAASVDDALERLDSVWRIAGQDLDELERRLRLAPRRWSDAIPPELVVRITSELGGQSLLSSPSNVGEMVGLLRSLMSSADPPGIEGAVRALALAAPRLEDDVRATDDLTGQLRALDENPDFRAMRDLLLRLANRQPLRRGDVVAMATRIQRQVDARLDQLARVDSRWAGLKRLIDAVLDVLPASLVEDENAPGGLRVDTASLVSALASEFAQQDRVGLYLRATVGAGYVVTSTGDAASCFYEEIGLGYRWSFANRRVLFGPHVAASGLLYQLQRIGDFTTPIFLAGGASVNLYRLIDVSANVGALIDVAPSTHTPVNFAFTIGLQLPLTDYIAAIASGTSPSTTTTTRSGATP